MDDDSIAPPVGRSEGQTDGRETERMCYSCGCKMPYADFGDPNNLIEDHFKKAGETATIEKAGAKTARENTLELLQLIKAAGEMDNPKEQY